MGKRIFSYLFILLISFSSAEVGAWLGVQTLRKRLVFYNAPLLSTYDDYMRNRDPVLGWPSVKMLREQCDPSGSRPIPSYPTAGTACISLYGDSFTWSDSVVDSAAWSNQLSLLRHCRVSNYGVPGYGTDQAFLRFEQNMGDEAPIVLLNHFSGDIRRNVTQLRNLTSDDDYLLLKPRFILEGHSLKLIPLLLPSCEDAEAIANHPEKTLPYEHFAPGGSTGIVRAAFPYSLSLLKALGNEHIRAKLADIPVWEPYYHPTHPSQALDITYGIMQKFIELARARGKTPLVTIIPNAHDIEFFRAHGRWTYSPLIERLEKEAVPHFDFGPELLKRMNDLEVCSLMEQGNCYGHYNSEGYKLMAEVLDRYLTETAVGKSLN